MVVLDSDFEDAARAALVENIEHEVVGKPDNLAHRTVQHAHEVLDSYGSRYDMNVDAIKDRFEGVDVTHHRDGITVRLEWGHPAGFFEVGTSPHQISASDGVLSFVWVDPPQWVREEFDQARGGGGRFQSGWRVFFPEVQHPGMPASRFVRRTLEWLQVEVS